MIEIVSLLVRERLRRCRLSRLVTDLGTRIDASHPAFGLEVAHFDPCRSQLKLFLYVVAACLKRKVIPNASALDYGLVLRDTLHVAILDFGLEDLVDYALPPKLDVDSSYGSCPVPFKLLFDSSQFVDCLFKMFMQFANLLSDFLDLSS